jgi:hypothetical protein
MSTETTPPAGWWSSLRGFPARMLAALADNTRDWRRGCGL